LSEAIDYLDLIRPELQTVLAHPPEVACPAR
jgi:hypothetical protein